MRRNRSSGNLDKIPLSASSIRLAQLEGGNEDSVLSESKSSGGLRRHQQQQRTIKLKRGVTAFSVYGPPLEMARGLIVCVHGLTMASYVFSDIASYLARSRWHVITYDLYGRGGSKLFPHVEKNRSLKYDDSFYVTQLQEFLEYMNLWNLPNEQRLVLCGASLGGAIAAAFCAKYPARVSKLILVAPVGVMDRTSLPVVARLHSSFGCCGRLAQYLLERCCTSCVRQYLVDSFQYSRWSDYVEHDIEQEGFVDGYWNTLKNFPFGEMADVYKKVEMSSDSDILILWGEQDRMVPFSRSKNLMEILPRARLISWPDVGHEITVGDGGKLVSSWMKDAIMSFVEGRVDSPAGGKRRTSSPLPSQSY